MGIDLPIDDFVAIRLEPVDEDPVPTIVFEQAV